MKNTIKFLCLFTIIWSSSAMPVSAQFFNGFETAWVVAFNSSVECSGYNTGVLTYGENINNDAHLNSNALTFTSPSTVTIDGCPSWFGFIGFPQHDGQVCHYMKETGGINLSLQQNSKLVIIAKSDVEGAVLSVYLGSTFINSVFPSSSTYDTGSGTVKVDFVLTTAYTTYVYDYSANPSDKIIWDAWTGNGNVNVYGFTPQTVNAMYQVQRVEVGENLTMSTSNTNSNSNRTSSVPPCGTAVNMPLAVTVSADNSVSITTESNGHILIDPSFVSDKVVVTDMVGRTEEFTGNDFYTQLRGVLVVNCISGDKVKKVKVVMD